MSTIKPVTAMTAKDLINSMTPPPWARGRCRGTVVRLRAPVAHDISGWHCDRLVLEHLLHGQLPGKYHARRMVVDTDEPRLTWYPPSYPEAWAR